MTTPLSLRLLPLIALSCALPALAQDAMKVAAEPLNPELHAKALPVQWQMPALVAAPAAQLRLLALPAERVDAVKRNNARSEYKRVQVGIERDLGSETDTWNAADLVWEPAAGGQVARLDVVAPGAEAVRVAIAVTGLPDSARLRYAGSLAEDEVYGVDVAEMRGQTDDQGRFWTIATSGERQRLEWFLPDAGADAAVPRVAGISHLIVDPRQGDMQQKALGASGSCNIDVVCRAGQLGAPFQQAKDSVAHMVFQDGGSFICTGTLLNDLDQATQRKWFYTAHHCFSTQGVANTLTTYWRRETATCNVDNLGTNAAVGGGADIRYNQASTDAMLLELRGNLPNHASFAGWDASALAANTAITAIHHPSGDIKKVSFGRYLRTQPATIAGQAVTSALHVTWDQGTTEGGSSGSGLFTHDVNSYYLRGGLFGGSASCGNSGQPEGSGNRDVYSNLNVVFPSIQQFIAASGSGGNNGATRDYTGQWANANQARRGLSMFRLTSGGLFALWFRYDSQNRPQWYQLEDIWTGQDRLGGRVARFAQNSTAPVFTGTYTLVFHSGTSATFTYNNVDGDSQTITLTKVAL